MLRSLTAVGKVRVLRRDVMSPEQLRPRMSTHPPGSDGPQVRPARPARPPTMESSTGQANKALPPCLGSPS